MNELEFSAPISKVSQPKRDDSFRTLYRDTPLASPVVKRSARRLPVGSQLEVPDAELSSDGILVALAALTLPAVIYSFAQLWSLLAGGSLTQAVRAFLP